MVRETCLRLRRLACLLAVVLALAVQLSAGALRNEAAAETRSDQLNSALASAMVICDGGNRNHATIPVRHRHRPDQGILGILACCSQDLAQLHDMPFVLTPNGAKTRRATLYIARAPPSRPLAASYPRGPPALV